MQISFSATELASVCRLSSGKYLQSWNKKFFKIGKPNPSLLRDEAFPRGKTAKKG